MSVAAPIAAFGLPARWRVPLALLALVWAGILGMHAGTAQSMAQIWSATETYAHGWVVPPIVLWLMWRQRSELATVSPGTSWLVLPFLILVSALWLAGEMVSVNAVTHFSLVTMLVAAVPFVLGWGALRVFAFPLGFLFMAVPLGDFMLPQLMSWTADFTVVALRLSGVPVYREGLQFIIPSGSWSVVEACSGIRYLVASIMAGCLYGHLHFRSLRLRVWFVVLSIAVALVANWLRAYMIVMLGHLSGNTLAAGVDHLIYGWAFFGVVLALLFWIGSGWSDPETSPHLQPKPTLQPSPPQAGMQAHWQAALVVLLVAGGSLLALEVFQRGVLKDPVALTLPPPQPGWESVHRPAMLIPAYHGANSSQQLAYAMPSGASVDLHVAYYRQQDKNRKLVSSTNVLVGSEDEHWAVIEQAVAEGLVGAQALKVKQMRLRSVQQGLMGDGQRLLVWQFFWINGHLTASPMKAKLLGALEMARGQGDDGAIVTLYTPDETHAERVLADFLKSHGNALLTALRATRGQD